MEDRARVALVLGAGGPVGFAYQAGALWALAEAGWDARDAALVVGTSIGAVVGALLRAGLSPPDLAAQAAGTPTSADGRDLLARGWRGDPLEVDLRARRRRGPPSSPALLRQLARSPGRGTLGLAMTALAPTGAVSTGSISTGFDAVLGGRWPTRPLRVVAADLDTGERLVFGAGPERPGPAIAASCAVPSYFAPVTIAGRRCVDGGVLSPSHVGVAASGPGSPYPMTVALVPMGLYGRPGRRGVDLPGRWMNARQARAGLRRLRVGGAATALLAPTSIELGAMGYDAFATNRLGAIVARARAATAVRIGQDPVLRSLVARSAAQATPATRRLGTGTGGGSPT